MNSKDKIRALKELKKLQIDYHQKQISHKVKEYINFDGIKDNLELVTLIGKLLSK